MFASLISNKTRVVIVNQIQGPAPTQLNPQGGFPMRSRVGSLYQVQLPNEN